MSDAHFVLLAAGADEMVWLGIVILFLVIGALGQVMAKIHEARRVEEARRRGPTPPARKARPVDHRDADPVRREVDDFVRASGERAAAPSRPAAPTAPRQPVPRPAGRRPTARPRRAEEPLDIAPAEVLPEPEDAGIADHVRSHVPAAGFGSFVSDVGTGLAQTPEAMAGHLHDVFDHRLGTLGGTPGESAEGAEAEDSAAAEDRVLAVSGTAAAGLAAVLAEPASLRQAVVLNEILARPEHRWET
jgi:hypothetical protein